MEDKKVVVEKTARGVRARLEDIPRNTPQIAENIKENEPALLTAQEQLQTLSGLVQRIQLANLAGLQYEGQRDHHRGNGVKNAAKNQIDDQQDR